MDPIRFSDPAGDYRELRAEIEAAVAAVHQSGQYILGEAVAGFEKDFARWLGAGHAVGVASGTDAIHLALRALGLKPATEVLIPALTAAATAMAVVHAGLKPRVVDVEPETLTLDPQPAANAVTPRTRVLLPVHLYGQPADLDSLLALAKKKGLRIVEDACQAHGATLGQKRVGALGDAGCFSFYPTKNLGAFGDGGMVVTRRAALAEAVRVLRNYGQQERDRSDRIGWNSRLDTLQAAILAVKLKHLPEWNRRRARFARLYDRLLAKEPVIRRMGKREGAASCLHLYVVRVPERDRVQARLAEKGIPTLVHYPRPIHLQPAFRYLGHRPGDFPVAEAAAKEILSLPLHPHLCPEQVEFVARALIAAVRQTSGA
jgi:dTDP-4-amino-4,6-dideoxygalactose transaminase